MAWPIAGRNLVGTLQLDGEVECIVEAKAAKHIHVHLRNLLRRHRLDVHAAFGAEHDYRAAGFHGRVDDHAHIVLLLDIQLLFHQNLFHLQRSLSPIPEGSGRDLGVPGVFGKLDASRLSTTSCPDLGLHRDRLPYLLRDLPGLFRGRGDLTLGNRHLCLLEYLFSLVFVQSSHSHLPKAAVPFGSRDNLLCPFQQLYLNSIKSGEGGQRKTPSPFPPLVVRLPFPGSGSQGHGTSFGLLLPLTRPSPPPWGRGER